MSVVEKKPFVIGAGFGRTGTMSLKVALEQLGFGPCYHMVEVATNAGHLQQWSDLADGKHVDLSVLLKNYNAAVDWPTVKYYKELLALHPDAKVILTTRDAESWYNSALNTIYQSSHPGLLVSIFFPKIARFSAMTKKIVWKGTFDDRFNDKGYAIRVYEKHIEEVRRVVPAENLLEFSVKDGWKPLCEFLQVPVPHGAFPNVNDQQEFQRRTRTYKRKVLLRAAIVLSVTGVAGYFAYKHFNTTSL